MKEFTAGTHKAESAPSEGPLRSDVVKGRAGSHSEESVVGGHAEQRDDRLRGVAVAPGRGSQAVADLNTAGI